ncbi:MAG: 3-dehydroquinate synthase [Calditrichaeota bacterium]|nr:3-dehydroquinate synthase [Calditrichota bacterium]
MSEIAVELGERSYPIIIAANALADLPLILEEGSVTKKFVLITDTRVSSLYGKKVLASLSDANFDVEYIEVAEGESSKQLSIYEYVVRKMITAGIDRSSAVLALGGGVVGDLAGFVAATYMRGIDFVQVPTTLLAQTDSSVGGKVGINLPEGKNLIGAFHQPKFVVIDPLVLKTLDRRELNAGFGEVVKYALIRDKELFALLDETEILSAQKLDFDLLEQIIARCCENKAEIVAQDEKEGGLRRILNFGHTPAHALEAATGYRYFRHGEAVIWGMRVMTYISVAEKLISKEKFKRIDKFMKRMPVPPVPKEISSVELLQYMKKDKKRISEKLPLILLSDIGATKIVTNLPEEKLRMAMDKVFNLERS